MLQQEEVRQENLLSLLDELYLQNFYFQIKLNKQLNYFFISLDTHSSKGPELPIQVVHP